MTLQLLLSFYNISGQTYCIMPDSKERMRTLIVDAVPLLLTADRMKRALVQESMTLADLNRLDTLLIELAVSVEWPLERALDCLEKMRLDRIWTCRGMTSTEASLS